MRFHGSDRHCHSYSDSLVRQAQHYLREDLLLSFRQRLLLQTVGTRVTTSGANAIPPTWIDPRASIKSSILHPSSKYPRAPCWSAWQILASLSLSVRIM